MSLFGKKQSDFFCHYNIFFIYFGYINKIKRLIYVKFNVKLFLRFNYLYFKVFCIGYLLIIAFTFVPRSIIWIIIWIILTRFTIAIIITCLL